MTVGELVKYLQENYSENQEVLIDVSVDGACCGEREFSETDIHNWGENQIIIAGRW